MAGKPAPTLGWEVVAAGDAGPGPRSRHGLVYDRSAKAAVLFGGIIWNAQELASRHLGVARPALETDQNLRNTARPPPRGDGLSRQRRTFAPVRRTGGNRRLLGDTWTYSGQRWRREGPGATAPSPRCGHSMVFDEQAGVAVLFGGINPHDKPLGDTWLFDGTSWKRVNGISPPAPLRCLRV